MTVRILVVLWLQGPHAVSAALRAMALACTQGIRALRAMWPVLQPALRRIFRALCCRALREPDLFRFFLSWGVQLRQRLEGNQERAAATSCGKLSQFTSR